VLALLVFVAVALVTVALALLLEWFAARQRKVRRAAARAAEHRGAGEHRARRRLAPPRRPGQAVRLVQRLSARVPHLRDMRHMLEQADLHWTVQTYLLLVGGLGIGLGAGGAARHRPLALRPRRRARRRAPLPLRGAQAEEAAAKFEELFPGAVDLLGRAIRAGHPFGPG
jgi:tight adherence protein B